MEHRWFHKKDGGLMIVDSPLWADGFYRCAICGERALYRKGRFYVFPYPGAPLVDIDDHSIDFAHFPNLPKDLQAAAIAEML